MVKGSERFGTPRQPCSWDAVLHFKQDSQTLSVLSNCSLLAKHLGWNDEDVIAKDDSKKVFIDYIKEVVTMYSDTRQNHCEDAQCILAMNMIHMILQDIEYVMSKNGAQQERLMPAFEIAGILRNQMLTIFGFQSVQLDEDTKQD